MNRLLLNLFYLYIFLLPLEDFFLQDIVGSPTRIAVGLLIFIYYYSGYRIKLKYIPVYIYIYLGIAVSSILFWANTPDYYAIIRITMWVVSAALLANLTLSLPKITTNFFKIYSITCLYLVYLALTSFLTSGNPDRVNVEDINDNILGMHFLIASLYCFYSLFSEFQKRYMKILLISGLILFIGSLITTGSRSGMLALGIGMLIILPKSLSKAGSLIFFSLFALILILSIGQDNVFIRFAGDRFTQAKEDKGAGRIVIWKVGMEMIKENPVLGVGFRNFPTEFKNYIDAAPLDIEETNKLGEREYAGAHNNAVEILAELGIFGFLSFYMLQIIICYKLYKVSKLIPIAKLIFAVIVALNLNGLFSDLTNLKMYWAILGIGAGVSYYGIKMLNKNSFIADTSVANWEDK